MTDADRLLREIVANPAADVLRLAFADAIEERDGPGDEAWAEFVRVQVGLAKRRGKNEGYRLTLVDRERELWPAVRGVFAADGVNLWCGQWPGGNTATPAALVSRGFVSHVRCTLAEWRGVECTACWGEGWRANHASDHPIINSLKCPDCHGTGRTPGIGPRLAQAWPVVEVEVTDRNPIDNRGVDSHFGGDPRSPADTWFWIPDDDPASRQTEWQLPRQICDMMPTTEFDSEFAARATLSAALIRWARSQAI